LDLEASQLKLVAERFLIHVFQEARPAKLTVNLNRRPNDFTTQLITGHVRFS
jgi:hypothetical protein